MFLSFDLFIKKNWKKFDYNKCEFVFFMKVIDNFCMCVKVIIRVINIS